MMVDSAVAAEKCPLVMDDGTDQFPFLGSLLKCHAEQLHHSAL